MTSGTSHLGTRARPASSAPFSHFFHEPGLVAKRMHLQVLCFLTVAVAAQPEVVRAYLRQLRRFERSAVAVEEEAGSRSHRGGRGNVVRNSMHFSQFQFATDFFGSRCAASARRSASMGHSIFGLHSLAVTTVHPGRILLAAVCRNSSNSGLLPAPIATSKPLRNQAK